MPENLKLLIADDHPIFRKGLLDVLKNTFSLSTIFEAENGKEALDKCQEEVPDIAILDIDMPEMNGLEICKEIHEQNLSTQVIILSMYKEEEMFNKAFLSGARGYVVKDNSVKEITEAIEKVMKGEKYIGPSLEEHFSKFSEVDKKKEKIKEMLSSLTQAELKTLKLVSQNKSSKEISELLFVSTKTIENYRSRICKKLELDSRNNSLLLWVSENRDILNSIKDF